MKAVLNSAFVYLAPSSIRLVGRLHKGPEAMGTVLIDASLKLNFNVGGNPKLRNINHQSEIDLSRIYCGYYSQEAVEKAFNQKGIHVLDRDPCLLVDTYILIIDQSENVIPLDIRRHEIAVILAGRNAKRIYGQLELASKVTRILDIPSATTFMSRRMREIQLSKRESVTANVARVQPSRTWSEQQMRAEEPRRMSGKDFPS